jgi:CheY-like chemotaxis protein
MRYLIKRSSGYLVEACSNPDQIWLEPEAGAPSKAKENQLTANKGAAQDYMELSEFQYMQHLARREPVGTRNSLYSVFGRPGSLAEVELGQQTNRARWLKLIPRKEKAVKTRVALVDLLPVRRQRVECELGQAGVLTVGSCMMVETLFKRVGQWQPELILIDVALSCIQENQNLRDLDPLYTLQKMVEEGQLAAPGPKVIVVGTGEEEGQEHFILRAVLGGASHYVKAGWKTPALLAAIAEVQVLKIPLISSSSSSSSSSSIYPIC